ncbi:hypothetical protein ACVWZA_001885 [Sphingomonas sp. UYAg733]
MSAFVWTDREGERHELDSPAKIEAEVAAIEQEKDRYVAMLDHPDRMIRDPARTAIGKFQPRLEQLRHDLGRWNEHAVAVTRAEAAKLAEQIDRLPAMIADFQLVVALHGEHDRLTVVTAGSPATRTQLLAEPMTDLQRRVIAACASRTAPSHTASRGEAKAWLDQQPRFARGGQGDGGWFAWADRAGHAHRLADPLAIEREVVGVAKELAELRPALTGNSAPDAVYAAINSGIASWERLRILQGDLERFEREDIAREDAAWTNYAADWRSKRKTS